MPVDPKPQFVFEFDKIGRMRLVHPGQSLEFLEQLDKSENLEIVVGATTTPPNMLTDCAEGKVPQPLKVLGCMNEICPAQIKLKLTQLTQEAWTNAVESGGGQ